MKQPNNPYYYNPYYNPYAPYPMDPSAPQTPYRADNSRAHLITGIVAGAAIAYLLSNRNVQKSIGATANKAWGAVRGEVEELKERLADVQAELDYYREKDQDSE
ncbi:YtxH domain-containing protein [Jinshanibacter sp. LJY008]|uniref:YtxH domain-containing protein n=1 Tax=Limnobaculum eriocheiris TaxID=2897391 RepID=A0A9X1MV06_9GAMM|nr:YtxH domain-containing protein [Limnobaculum eriocheiris]MCD1125123.1 YtxH domain-containing protein [Limnobaculum eriocheiris]